MCKAVHYLNNQLVCIWGPDPLGRHVGDFLPQMKRLCNFMSMIKAAWTLSTRLRRLHSGKEAPKSLTHCENLKGEDKLTPYRNSQGTFGLTFQIGETIVSNIFHVTVRPLRSAPVCRMRMSADAAKYLFKEGNMKLSQYWCFNEIHLGMAWSFAGRRTKVSGREMLLLAKFYRLNSFGLKEETWLCRLIVLLSY